MCQITSPIVHIINTSIDKKIFPDSWKVARVCPIPKIDNPVTVKDFRPISILSVLSKVFEKVVLSQLLNYIEKSAVYNPTQSGFRKRHSTATLPLKFKNGARNVLNQNEITISVLIDYSKAFGTINYKTLLEKLVSWNFSNRTIKITMSYVTNRHQYVQIDNQTSPKCPVHFGVPQGGTLGPTLFKTYVAELPSCIYSDSIQYSDDTTIYRACRPSDILQEIRKLENDIKTVSEWSAGNGLVFNNDKLKYITFSSKRKVNDKSYLIRSNRKSIVEKTAIKLLEVNFVQDLT